MDIKLNDFDRIMATEAEKEKQKECRKRKGNCYDCPYREDCEYEAIINDLDEW